MIWQVCSVTLFCSHHSLWKPCKYRVQNKAARLGSTVCVVYCHETYLTCAAVSAAQSAAVAVCVCVCRTFALNQDCQSAATGAHFSCPNTRKVHQTLAALNRPERSYTTTCVLFAMPRESAAAAKACSEGSMCGKPLFLSAMLSMSKKRLPGMRLFLNCSFESPLPARLQQV